LYEQGTKTGVVGVRFVKEGPPTVEQQDIPDYIPPEWRSGFEPLPHPSEPEKVIQAVGYYEQRVSMDQVMPVRHSWIGT
jgi:hypothetical protein